MKRIAVSYQKHYNVFTSKKYIDGLAGKKVMSVKT